MVDLELSNHFISSVFIIVTIIKAVVVVLDLDSTINLNINPTVITTVVESGLDLVIYRIKLDNIVRIYQITII